MAEGRTDLQSALKEAAGGGQFQMLAATYLAVARSYCTHIEPNQVEVDKYLDRYLEIKSQHPFASKYLDNKFERLKSDRLELPSQWAFYFRSDDLEAGGHDAGLSKYLVWAIHYAQGAAHGDVEKMTEILGFKTLARTYKYLKLARAVENGNRTAAQKINKTHTVHAFAKE